MKIGIIGTGMIGGTLVRRLTQLGHTVEMANSRGPATLTELAAETGATPVDIRQVVNNKAIVIVTIPLHQVAKLPVGLFSIVPDTTIVIDTNNYYPTIDGSIPAIEEGLPESRWVEQQLGRAVIKVFNGIIWDHLGAYGKPKGDPARIALPVAGDDLAAKQQVMHLVDALGFDPVDAGGLDESWRQQPGTPCYGVDLGFDALKQALAAASPTRGPEWRSNTPRE